MAFLVRLIGIVAGVVVACVVLYLIIVLVNRGIQMLAESLGYEVGDFFSWLRSKLPKRKRRRY